MDNVLSNLTQYEGDHYNRINYLKCSSLVVVMRRDSNFNFLRSLWE